MNYTEVDILNFVEGHFDDQQTAQILGQIRIDSKLAAAVEAMQVSQLPIAQAYERESTPSVPQALRNQIDALTQASQLHETKRKSLTDSLATRDENSAPSTAESNHHDTKTRFSKLTKIGLVACLVSGVGIGTVATQIYLQQNSNETSSASVNTEAGQSSGELRHERLVNRVADYQSLYVENTVANLSESPTSDALKLLESIDSLGDSPTRLPDFSELGYEFARAQELGFEGKTLVQLVYRKPGSAPLALCFMPDSKTRPLTLKVSMHHGLNAAGWVADNRHYVLIAQESDAIMKRLYDTASDVL